MTEKYDCGSCDSGSWTWTGIDLASDRALLTESDAGHESGYDGNSCEARSWSEIDLARESDRALWSTASNAGHEIDAAHEIDAGHETDYDGDSCQAAS